MQKYKLLEQGKDCALYRMTYSDGTYKYMVKDVEGDILAMAVTHAGCPPDTMQKLVRTYDLSKVHAERRAEHNKWVEEFVEK